jgi:uncharacterized RDD family membrane protein YckC
LLALGRAGIYQLCSSVLAATDWIDQMDTDGTDLEGIKNLPRAGFWRRWLGTLIDWIVVAVPFQVLAVILFAMTSGMVQMHGGLFFNACDVAKTIPQSLDPPPPHDSNFARICRISLFGAPTGITLTVGRMTRDGLTTKTVTQSYMLDRNGNPIKGISLDWIALLTFLAYLVGMIWKRGRTIGGQVVGVKVVDTAEPDRSWVAMHKAIVRYLAIAIGFVPGLALLIYQRSITSGNADDMFTEGFFRWLIVAGLLGLVWSVLLIIQIARKGDPVYDRLAGTAVVRDWTIEPAKSGE